VKGQKVARQHVPGFHHEGYSPARRAVATVLAMAFVILLPATITSVWIRGTLLSASGYVAAVTPVAANPAVRAEIQEVVTSQVDAALSRAGGSLPPAARVLAGALADVAENGITEFMTSPAFQRLWAGANKVAHAQLVSVLNGDSALVATTGGQVVLNLLPLVNQALLDASSRVSDLSGGAVTLRPITALPAAACHALNHASSSACAQIPLFPGSELARAQLAYRILTAATWLALILTPLFFAGALATAPARRRRRTLLQMTFGGTLALVLTLAALCEFRSALISREAPRYQAMTSAIAHALTGSLFTLLTWFIIGGCVIAAGALLPAPAPGLLRAIRGLAEDHAGKVES
jgi:hypothetical protein